MADNGLDDLPGFRRWIRITPEIGRTVSEVEDDYHHMRVTITHDNVVATSVVAEMFRSPWTTCPGAKSVVEETFTNVPLAAFWRRGEKKTNCTHLHDLAVLAGAHALGVEPLVYSVLVADPIGAEVEAELRRNGAPVLHWILTLDDAFIAPAPLVGYALTGLNPWIATLDPAGQEQARILRWAALMAHGRKHMQRQDGYENLELPVGQCFTFQPERMVAAERQAGTFIDFSMTGKTPLAS